MYDCRKCKWMPYTVCSLYFYRDYNPFIKADRTCSEYIEKNLWQKFVYWWRHK